ncbi:hypothetical protein W97_06177 [Coniosporium apollinis CBS 100218]|uniref:Trimethylguanosine synthase n=1 Tax=Coniosporium apollinis (strain CBS 100218) TaxID=1168221 RepID=R7YYP5_CONA1|nr:uncharacterized protein W97_06177 [Coniosporium apollinis CBS 100218]EON67060.1 hypothetical protein W97_06177 [Coniosporium apollinis CBS 100218]
MGENYYNHEEEGAEGAEDAETGTPGIFHHTHHSQVPVNTRKYFSQRYKIFSKYDEGVWMTDDAWFGVTPEPVANKIAEHMVKIRPTGKRVLIDAFAGAGGNAIAFARSGEWDQIFAIEQDPQVLQCAKHNAEVYGVASKIWWYEGDCFQIIKTKLAQIAKTQAVIFASPPWGGPSYNADKVFDLSTMQPYTLHDLYSFFSKYTKDVVLYLPRTSDLNQVARYAPEGRKLEVVHYCALCAYYGDFSYATGWPVDEDESALQT